MEWGHLQVEKPPPSRDWGMETRAWRNAHRQPQVGPDGPKAIGEFEEFGRHDWTNRRADAVRGEHQPVAMTI